MKNKKGFSLFEFMLVIMVLFIVTIVALPMLLYAIKAFRINAFKNSANNVLESVKYYIVNNDFITIPKEGIEISNLDLELDHDNFDNGLIKQINEDEFELIYLKKDNYCAMGTINNLKATSEGCGALDETRPSKVHLYLKNATSTSLTLLAEGIDEESEIVYYEFSIDNKNFTKKSTSNIYTFDNLEKGTHKVQVRVTNESDMSSTSEIYEFNTRDVSNIECVENDYKENFQIEKNVICTYPNGEDYSYQYSEDNINWNIIGLTENKYTFNFKQNKTIYTRVLKNNNVIATSTINVNNIDNILNGAYPELLENMIPVVYDFTQDSWIKADSRTIYWDYENKIWANAVLVRRNANTADKNSKNREYYLSNDAIGEKIYEKDILGYYVWIPRYKYILFNVSNKKIEPQIINISFEGKDKEKSLGMYDNNYINNEWYTHPAFSYNSESNGFWVSKFQNSIETDSNCYNLKDEKNCNRDDLTLYSVPNVNSLTNISIGKASLLANNMIKENNIYGLTKGNSHIITNLEWGAIAYLTNSKYGINSNLINNNQNYKNNLTNSTTGNITGVFDMSGKNMEFIMGNFNQDAGKDKKDNSEFEEFGNIKWPNAIDYYKGITSKNRILGDAIGETINWYNSSSNFINGEYPFIIRGGIVNSIPSIYNYDKSTGSPNNNISIRTVLTK